MSIRVHVIQSPNFALDHIAISIVNRQDDGPLYIYRPASTDGTFSGTWEDIPTDARNVDPSFRLPHDMGRALLDALAHHYEGAEDTRRLRADYDAALRRADEQTKVIADVVRTLATRAAQ